VDLYCQLRNEDGIPLVAIIVVLFVTLKSSVVKKCPRGKVDKLRASNKRQLYEEVKLRAVFSPFLLPQPS
jgi:hypothetical protein